MAENNEHGRGVNEYVLGTLDDDSDDESDEEEMECGDREETEYEEKTLREIFVIKGDVEKVANEIRQIATGEKEKCDKYAEYLLQTIIKLDNIDTKNNANIREARKGAILYAQTSLQVLDTKLNSVTSNGEQN
ncbi:BAG domain containing protein [Asbolus verrucosus]|uniref:BAG domain containing protein n=1 Tax=Asbolus verrucosus TaxID=1661398 RepID=A0A482VL02_ASBVE|nr:BAG domain containing protein [Asbolus verrucosus]